MTSNKGIWGMRGDDEGAIRARISALAFIGIPNARDKAQEDAIVRELRQLAARLLPVECAACGWKGRRTAGKIVTCPKCGAAAAYQPDEPSP